jgi:hypothetical protein
MIRVLRWIVTLSLGVTILLLTGLYFLELAVQSITH